MKNTIILSLAAATVAGIVAFFFGPFVGVSFAVPTGFIFGFIGAAIDRRAK